MTGSNAPSLELRRASALVVTLRKKDVYEVTNFLQQISFLCNSQCLEILSGAADWKPAQGFFTDLSGYQAASVAQALTRLVGLGALVVKGSKKAQADEDYADHWEWGAAAGLFHFGTKDVQFLTGRAADRHIEMRARIRTAPVMYTKNDDAAQPIKLPSVKSPDAVLTAMLRRRTIRVFKKTSITQEELGECLFSGLGIIGFYDHPILGRMPLTLTPSGGARNPYEAYVYCQNIRGVERGIYHYSALEHSLGRVGPSRLPRASRILSGQTWVDDAAAVLFLVANFDRTMWKYEFPLSYLVVIVEAGHIAQNIAVTAAKLGMVANPTMAIQETIAERALGIGPPLQSVVYAMSLGYPNRRYDPLARSRPCPLSAF